MFGDDELRWYEGLIGSIEKDPRRWGARMIDRSRIPLALVVVGTSLLVALTFATVGAASEGCQGDQIVHDGVWTTIKAPTFPDVRGPASQFLSGMRFVLPPPAQSVRPRRAETMMPSISSRSTASGSMRK